jgi:YegS/Rv2252/BmrU family lipid kinase
MKKLLFIYNPVAGNGKLRGHLGELVERFVPFGYEVTLHPTQGRGDARDFARSRGGEFDHIVCAGGDGTLNEVISGLIGVENAPALGYIPTGTTNDFSRTLGLPSGMVQAADFAVMGHPELVDMGEFNERTFVYVAAFGLFSEVSYTTPQEMKNTLGHLAYVISGISSLGASQPYHVKVEYEGGMIEDDFIYGMVSDTVSVGGVIGLKKERVCLTDGKFEVMLVRKPQNPMELNEILLALMKQHPQGNVMGFSTSWVKFTCDQEVPWTLDGEFGGKTREAEVHVHRQAVRLMVNPQAPALIPPQEETEAES